MGRSIRLFKVKDALLNGQARSKWKDLLEAELAQRRYFEALDSLAWERVCSRHQLTSTNHDTVLSLDWPHYCIGATAGCGGSNGWCYTFHGRLAKRSHVRRVAFNDVFAEKRPPMFADRVAREVQAAVDAGKIPYANLRYSGSGELAPHHVPALRELAEREIHLWGFARRIDVAKLLREMGASVIFSCDATTAKNILRDARKAELPLAYSSTGVDDQPPDGTIVTFPIHRGKFVREVVQTNNLCPKVVQQYLFGERQPSMCQFGCLRCHRNTKRSI